MDYNRHVCFRDLNNYLKKNEYLSGYTPVEQDLIRKNIGAIGEADLINYLTNGKCIELTYDELQNLIKNKKLGIGQIYIITDFQTIYSSNVQISPGVYQTWGSTINPSKVFKIITLALTSDTLYTRVIIKSDQYPNSTKWVVEYDYEQETLSDGEKTKGKIKNGETVSLVKNNGEITNFKISKLFVNEGIKKVEKQEAYYGDIVTIAGCSHISIGDTINELNCIDPLPPIEIEKPTLSMNFLVNNGPFAGQSGKFLTTRHIKERLERELETNVGLEVEELPSSDGFKVSGRGELHLSILLENMRREGYELCVSKPEVLFKEIDGKKCEPFETVIVNVPNDYASTVINALQERKGMLLRMENEENYTHLEFEAPTRGLLGYRSAFITDTKGEGIMVRSFSDYKPYAGPIASRKNGVLVSMETGKSLGYSLFNLQERGTLIIGPATDVYVGMIVGINNRDNDLNVNPCKNKEMSNTRSKSSDEAINLITPKTFSLEESLEFIADDEYVEITPAVIRLRKKILDPKERFRVSR